MKLLPPIHLELKDIELCEMELRLEKARERYEAYEGQFERRRQAGGTAADDEKIINHNLLPLY